MGKDLDLHGAVAADEGDLLPGQLPGQHHPADAHPGGLQHALQGVNAHLGGGVDGNGRRQLANQLHQPQVLDDEGVHPQPGGGADDVRGRQHLPVRDQDIQRQMDLHAPDVAVGHRLLQLFQGKVFRAPAGVERVEAQIDRVGPILHGSPQRVHGAGGREKFQHNASYQKRAVGPKQTNHIPGTGCPLGIRSLIHHTTSCAVRKVGGRQSF